MSEQAEHIERVSSRISEVILEFHAQRVMYSEWHVEELRQFVLEKTGVLAPASSDRILRDLRHPKRLLNYEVVSRRASLYRFVPVLSNAPEQPSLFAKEPYHYGV